MITELLIGAGALWLINRNRKPKVERTITGIGAVKRRIYKELSLAQQAGVDFTKPFDELSADEIRALERVSHDTGYTETYYKSLQKAYNAISGIGEAYDVVNEDGETVLTWIENPDGTQTPVYRAADDAERYAALREAHDIDEDRIWAENNCAQAFEEREARLAEQRKRLRKAGRTSQMSLFGCNGADNPTYSRQQLDTYLDTFDVLELVAEYISKNKILCSMGDARGGRGFYLNRNNFIYLFNYCLARRVPIAVWNGAYWITRNDGDQLVAGCGYAPEVEAELWEIWREQIENETTDYDYNTWRAIYGEEYAEKEVIPFMR